MLIAPENIYHIYNRGNNKEDLFFQERNYDFFLQKTVKQLSPYLDFLAYCLMTNHFHFMVYTKPSIEPGKFSQAFGKLLSSYTRAIQNQERRTGSLFQQNSKSIEVVGNEYAFSCFNYIHQNPLKAGMVKRIEDWPYHSFNEYWNGVRGICNMELGRKMIGISRDREKFYSESKVVPPLSCRESKWWHD